MIAAIRKSAKTYTSPAPQPLRQPARSPGSQDPPSSGLVRNHQDRLPHIPEQLPEQLKNLPRRDAVPIRGRLTGKENLWLVDERYAQSQVRCCGPSDSSRGQAHILNMQVVDALGVISVTDDGKSCWDSDAKTLNTRNNIRYIDA